MTFSRGFQEKSLIIKASAAADSKFFKSHFLALGFGNSRKTIFFDDFRTIAGNNFFSIIEIIRA